MHKSDTCCWTCHGRNAQLFCRTCIRSFHKSPACSKVKNIPVEAIGDWRCQDCLDMDEDVKQLEKSEMDSKYLNNEILTLVLSGLREYDCLEDAFMDIDYSSVKRKVVHPMDLKTIGANVSKENYRCIDDFVADIMWISHNIRAYLSDDKQLVQEAKRLIKYTKMEIHSVRICHECYRNANLHPDDWFTKPCTKPHLLVWAKLRGYPYWPAKVLKVKGDQEAEVHFFGGHTRAVLPLARCYIYSKTYPSVSLDSKRKKQFDTALNEANEYIENLVAKYGRFNYAAPFFLLVGNMLERHMFDMIPQAWKTLKNPVTPPPIPKTIPARRHSMYVRRLTVSPDDPKRVSTRRMSALQIMDDPQSPIVSTPDKSTAFNKPIGLDTVSSSLKKKLVNVCEEPPAKVVKRIEAPVNTPSPIQVIPVNEGATGHQNDAAMFKVPEIPRRRKSSLSTKTTETKAPSKVGPAGYTNANNRRFEPSFSQQDIDALCTIS